MLSRNQDKNKEITSEHIVLVAGAELAVEKHINLFASHYYSHLPRNMCVFAAISIESIDNGFIETPLPKELAEGKSRFIAILSFCNIHHTHGDKVQRNHTPHS